jgi:hypothetical protein
LGEERCTCKSWKKIAATLFSYDFLKFVFVCCRDRSWPGNFQISIIDCGRLILEKFTLDNQRLMGVTADTGTAQMAQTMRLMGTMMGDMRGMIVQQGRELNMLRTQLALITSGVSSVQQDCGGMPPRPPSRCEPCNAGKVAWSSSKEIRSWTSALFAERKDFNEALIISGGDF